MGPNSVPVAGLEPRRPAPRSTYAVSAPKKTRPRRPSSQSTPLPPSLPHLTALPHISPVASLPHRALEIPFSLGAIVMALAEVRMVFWFVLFAWSGLACAFTPVVLCSLFWKGTTRAGAIAGIIGGFVTTVT